MHDNILFLLRWLLMVSAIIGAVEAAALAQHRFVECAAAIIMATAAIFFVMVVVGVWVETRLGGW